MDGKTLKKEFFEKELENQDILITNIKSLLVMMKDNVKKINSIYGEDYFSLYLGYQSLLRGAKQKGALYKELKEKLEEGYILICKVEDLKTTTEIKAVEKMENDLKTFMQDEQELKKFKKLKKEFDKKNIPVDEGEYYLKSFFNMSICCNCIKRSFTNIYKRNEELLSKINKAYLEMPVDSEIKIIKPLPNIKASNANTQEEQDMQTMPGDIETRLIKPLPNIKESNANTQNIPKLDLTKVETKSNFLQNRLNAINTSKETTKHLTENTKKIKIFSPFLRGMSFFILGGV